MELVCGREKVHKVEEDRNGSHVLENQNKSRCRCRFSDCCSHELARNLQDSLKPLYPTIALEVLQWRIIA